MYITLPLPSPLPRVGRRTEVPSGLAVTITSSVLQNGTLPGIEPAQGQQEIFGVEYLTNRAMDPIYYVGKINIYQYFFFIAALNDKIQKLIRQKAWKVEFHHPYVRT